jgi:hypothetical protein
VQYYGCGALSNLAVNDYIRVRIAAAGGITAIQAALKNHSLNAGVQEKGHEALRNFDCNTDNKVVIAKVSGIVAIMLLFKIIHCLYLQET